MKELFLFFIFVTFSSSASARWLTLTDYHGLSADQKVAVLQVLKHFMNLRNDQLIDEKQTVSLPSLISLAYASSDYDCFYAGWPSVKVKSSTGKRLCSSPAKHNSNYQPAACPANSLQCQPILFGAGICADISSQSKRNSAFAQCEKKFASSGRSADDVIQFIARPENANQAEELFGLVEKICSAEPSSICRSLEEKLKAIKQNKLPAASEFLTAFPLMTADPEQTAVQKAVNNVEQLAETVESVSQVECHEDHDHALHQEVPQGEETPAEGFPRVLSRLTNPCHQEISRDGYVEKFAFECSSSSANKVSAGFVIRSKPTHPLFQGLNPYGTLSKPYRLIEFRSDDQALNSTFLYLADFSMGPDSHDVKSVMFLLPRKSPPTVSDQGETVEVTLATGEKVVIEKSTGAVKSGSLKEGAPDFNLDRFKRKPPQVDYTGKGISIRLNHRFEHPTMGSDVAEVTQQGRICKIPRTKLFNSEGQLTTQSDADLLQAINSHCPIKPGLKPFSL